MLEHARTEPNYFFPFIFFPRDEMTSQFIEYMYQYHKWSRKTIYKNVRFGSVSVIDVYITSAEIVEIILASKTILLDICNIVHPQNMSCPRTLRGIIK